ncbi:DUF6503 family protein [Muriicola sp. Z0-33]|uniref:DUF6503 family protein n=1 Tax=Muriicola sp. Z0-33 TaxID=2816957 RepID=UPI0022383F9A|nr:DUF6503 family protein [Muriicola sp. Z0-33]MCW5516556.1 deoxyribose-phosphate aldolase [Muriicola sp. Z0-33]
MKPYFLLLLLILTGCAQKSARELTAQQIIDKAIEVSGGERYEKSHFSFDFRDKQYLLTRDMKTNKKLLIRMWKTDSTHIIDTKGSNFFKRVVDGKEAIIADSMAHKYANSINSVHYFAYLPYGLNDAAVNKKLLGEAKIKDSDYYKVQVTFNQEGGGDDYDDVYLYWFNKETFKPDYLAYEFHVDGGGMRFREAYNERYIEGIRFVDYNNYKPKEDISIMDIEELFLAGELELLSKIELTNIEVAIKD